AAGLEVAALGVEHRLHLFHQEGDVAALAEHRGHDPGERDDPLEVLHRLGVDEDLERAAVLVLGAGVEHDVVDGHVHGVLHQRRLDLVGAADQDFRALDALVHLDDVVVVRFVGRRLLRGLGARGFLRLVLGGDDGVALDFLLNPDGHGVLVVLLLVVGTRPLHAGEGGSALLTSSSRPSWRSSSPGPSSRLSRARLSSRPSSALPSLRPSSARLSSWPSSVRPSSRPSSRLSSPWLSWRPSWLPSSPPASSQPASSWPPPSCRSPSSSGWPLPSWRRRWRRRASSSPWPRSCRPLSSPCRRWSSPSSRRTSPPSSPWPRSRWRWSPRPRRSRTPFPSRFRRRRTASPPLHFRCS